MFGAKVMIGEAVHFEPIAALTRVLQLMANLKARRFPEANTNRTTRQGAMRALEGETTRL
jgi:hypothetical protein